MTGFTSDKASEILARYITEATYVGLSTTEPTRDGGNVNEPPTANGYARHAFGKVNQTIAGQVTNDEIIFLFEATGDCGSVTHAIMSETQARGGKIFLAAELLAPLTITAGYVPLIRAKNFIVGLDKDSLEAYA